MVSLLLVVPDQPLRLLGAELLILAATSGTVLATLDRRASQAAEPSVPARTLDVVCGVVNAWLLLVKLPAIK